MSEVVPPPALTWVALFVASANRATDGDFVSADLDGQTDPLEWILTMTSRFTLNARSSAFLKATLKGWAEANNAMMGKARIQNNTFRAQIYIKGLGPEQNKNPYEESP